jgi:hypothetical protein
MQLQHLWPTCLRVLMLLPHQRWLTQMQLARTASAASVAAVTVMAVTDVSAMANAVIVLNVQSAATMQRHPHRLRQLPTVVRAILQSPTAALHKDLVLLLRLPRWPTLPCH